MPSSEATATAAAAASEAELASIDPLLDLALHVEWLVAALLLLAGLRETLQRHEMPVIHDNLV